MEVAVRWKWQSDGSGSPMEVAVRWKWKSDGSGSPMEVEVRWKWKSDGSGSPMEVAVRWKWQSDGSGSPMEVEVEVRWKWQSDGSGSPMTRLGHHSILGIPCTVQDTTVHLTAIYSVLLWLWLGSIIHGPYYADEYVNKKLCVCIQIMAVSVCLMTRRLREGQSVAREAHSLTRQGPVYKGTFYVFPWNLNKIILALKFQIIFTTYN